MFLAINMSERDCVHLALFDKNFIEEKRETGRNRILLPVVHGFLEEKKCGPQDLRGIMVVVGTGSFTSTRIGCVIANTFAYALKIPLLAIEKDDMKRLPSLIPRLLTQHVGVYISASYSGEPNIGVR